MSMRLEWCGVWKLELQQRQAPRIYVWGPRPQGLAGEIRQTRSRPAVGDGLPYPQWLSAVWSDIVFVGAGAEPRTCPDTGRGQRTAGEQRHHQRAGTAVGADEGTRMTSPRQAAVYFAQYGSCGRQEHLDHVPRQWQAPGRRPGRYWGYKGMEKQPT